MGIGSQGTLDVVCMFSRVVEDLVYRIEESAINDETCAQLGCCVESATIMFAGESASWYDVHVCVDRLVSGCFL